MRASAPLSPLNNTSPDTSQNSAFDLLDTPTDPDWERVLWKRQKYCDNFVPPDKFLSSLRKNQNFRPYTYSQLVTQASAIAQHLSTIFIFLAIFVRLYTHTLDPRVVVWSTVFLYCLGFFLWTYLEQTNGETCLVAHAQLTRVQLRKPLKQPSLFPSPSYHYPQYYALSQRLRHLTLYGPFLHLCLR
jgi:hypothetical protein